MPETEWKPLLYTYDRHGDLLSWNGKTFPSKVKDRLFDLQWPNGGTVEKCLIVCNDAWTTAEAVTQEGYIFGLWHGVLLRPNPDVEVEKKLQAIYDKHLAEKKQLEEIADLRMRESDLLNQLAKIYSQLLRLNGGKR
jgi:hypothetical protein